MKTKPLARTDVALPAAGPEGVLQTVWGSIDRFFFTPVNPATLCMIRICAGLIAFYIHLAYSFDLMAYVGPNVAWLDRQAVDYIRKEMPLQAPPDSFPSNGLDDAQPQEPFAHGRLLWSLYFHVSDPRGIWAIHIGILVVMFLFTIGFCTRVTSVLTWVGAMCYIQRAYSTLFGMDSMMIVTLMYLMIGPCGAKFSVDRLIERWRQRKRLGKVLPVEPSVSANFALRLIQIHFCFIYMASGMSKLLGGLWWNGTAIYYTLANWSFAPMTVGIYMHGLVFLCQHRWLWELFMTGGSWFTLFMELGLPFLIWSRRMGWVMVTGSVLLHFGIGMLMGLACFSLFMMTMVSSWIPPEAVDRLVANLGEFFRGLWRARPRLQAAAEKRGELVLTRN